jgi:gluconate 2-dehydrogenase gamma chain
LEERIDIDGLAAISRNDQYIPRLMSTNQFTTLIILCRLIIPADGRSGDAVDAGAPEFIDLVTSENLLLELKIVGGITWLDATCCRLYGQHFGGCTSAQQREIIDVISNKQSLPTAPWAAPGIAFFSVVRKLTVDAFFTSAIGISDLQYKGNTQLTEFSGCPSFAFQGITESHTRNNGAGDKKERNHVAS